VSQFIGYFMPLIPAMEIKKFAAIDIGSNSVRLLIEHVIETPKEAAMFKKNSLIRVPVRLGPDAFTDHKIPEATVKRLIEAMMGYKYIMKVNEVIHYKGCATSAMREAKNGAEIVKRIEKETGIKIEIISGNNEANMIFNSQNFIASKIGNDCLFVDVGGGSTEITVFIKGKAVAARSFDIGTIRLLSNQVKKEYWKELKDWLKKETKTIKAFSLVGSGGNINRLFKMAELKQGKPLTFELLQNMTTQIKKHSIDDRIKIFDLNPDRADVIVPAGEIFLNIMKFVGATKIYVPKIGLSDGMVREVYKEYKEGKRTEIV
jgi:exopolyphosphatase/guanosine-5'-triphosphate,3'-diphosphate pyrophosphatase